MTLKELNDMLQERLFANHQFLMLEWMEQDAAWLINKSVEIAATEQVYIALRKYQFRLDEAQYLMQFQMPLEVIRDYWYVKTNEIFPDDLVDALEDITSNGFGLNDYDIDQEVRLC